jgi:hypothetical protein
MKYYALLVVLLIISSCVQSTDTVKDVKVIDDSTSVSSMELYLSESEASPGDTVRATLFYTINNIDSTRPVRIRWSKNAVEEASISDSLLIVCQDTGVFLINVSIVNSLDSIIGTEDKILVVDTKPKLRLTIDGGLVLFNQIRVTANYTGEQSGIEYSWFLNGSSFKTTSTAEVHYSLLNLGGESIGCSVLDVGKKIYLANAEIRYKVKSPQVSLDLTRLKDCKSVTVILEGYCFQEEVIDYNAHSQFETGGFSSTIPAKSGALSWSNSRANYERISDSTYETQFGSVVTEISKHDTELVVAEVDELQRLDLTARQAFHVNRSSTSMLSKSGEMIGFDLQDFVLIHQSDDSTVFALADRELLEKFSGEHETYDYRYPTGQHSERRGSIFRALSYNPYYRSTCRVIFRP